MTQFAGNNPGHGSQEKQQTAPEINGSSSVSALAGTDPAPVTRAPDASLSGASLVSPVEPAASAFDRMTAKMGIKAEEREVLSTVNTIGKDAEAGYQKGRQTVDTPTHRAVWEGKFDKEHYTFKHEASPPDAAAFRAKACDLVLAHIRAGTLLEENGKLSEAVLKDLGSVGWWGQMVKEKFGGLGHPKVEVAKNMTAMSAVNAYIGGLASVHGSIGLVWPVSKYGNPEQQRKYLPLLASGEKLSAFALTEPSVGSDVSLIKAEISADGDGYLLNGEKLFITNAAPGRLVGVVAKLATPIKSTVNINGKEVENVEKRAVFIVQLPDEAKTENFEIRPYGIQALSQIYNQGLAFKNFKVSEADRLDPTIGGTALGDGLTIGFTGLNNGRLAVLANASGSQRAVLGNIVPWVQFRSSFGKTLDKHPHVQEMVGRMAANIVATEALRDWVAQLMDKGFNCEMEAMNAKIFGSECQDQSTEFFLKIQGGRSFLTDNPYIEMLREGKACKVYEGENGLLHLGHEKQVLSDFNERYAEVLFDPSRSLAAKAGTGIKLMGWLAGRGAGWVCQKIVSNAVAVKDAVTSVFDKSAEGQLERFSHFAENKLQNYWIKTFATFARYGAGLVREETVIRQRGAQKINLMQIKAISEWGRTHPDPVYRQAAVVKCQELKNKYQGRETEEARPDAHSRYAADLGRKVLKGQFDAIDGVPLMPIAKPYDPKTGKEVPKETEIKTLSVADLQAKSEAEAAAKKRK